MNRYEHGKIYKIVDVGYNKCYIGCTTEPLSKRMDRHRKYYKQYLEKGKIDTRSRMMFDEYGVENCKIELIENYPCNSKEELLRREGEYIKNIECVNKCVAGRTAKEYKQEHKEYFNATRREHYKNNKEAHNQKVKEYQEQHKEEIAKRRHAHYEANKDIIAEKQREYYQNNKEAIKQRKAEYAKHNKEFLAQIHKKWCQNNIERVKQKSKEYYDKNKDKICEQRKATIECGCGSVVRRHEIKQHEKTKTHQEWLKQQERETQEK